MHFKWYSDNHPTPTPPQEEKKKSEEKKSSTQKDGKKQKTQKRQQRCFLQNEMTSELCTLLHCVKWPQSC